MRRILIIIFSLFIFLGTAFPQNAKLTATCNVKTVGLNSYFQVTYTLSGGTAQSFYRPSFKNFNIIGQYQSTGGGMTIIVNGKTIQGGSDESSWTFQLSPTSIGKFTIDAAKAIVNGQSVLSNSLSIEVTAGANKQNNTNQQNKSNTKVDASGKDLYIQAFADKTNPLQGEQVIVTFKIYTRIPVTQYAINKLSSFTGFWSQDLLKDIKNPQQYTETVNGVQYSTAIIRKVALFPQQCGALTINSLEVECLAQVKSQKQSSVFDNFFNDPFFNIPNMFDSYQNVKKKIYSNPLTIYVRPLPVANKPSSFKGAVGYFSMNSEIDKTELKANDAATLKFTISGKGNLNLIDKLDIDFPPDLETYDPKLTDNIISNDAGISGSRTFEYLIIPRNPGTYKIKPINFSYYDLTKQSYVTLSSPEYTLKVGKGSGSSNVTVSGINQEDIKYIGSDIRYIKNQTFSVHQIGSFFFGSWTFFLLFFLPLVLFIIFVIVWRKQLKERSNIALMKNKKATKVALRRLKKASHYLQVNDKISFYDEIFKALWGYLSDKLNIPIADLSKDTITLGLQQKKVDEGTIAQFVETLNNCEFARFAPSGESITMQSIFDEAMSIITKIEKELR